MPELNASNRHSTFALRFALASLALVVAGCSSTASRIPHPYQIELVANEQVNPDAQGRASPLQVTVFELSARTAFESTDYFSLQSDSQTALRGELVSSDQIILRPGQRHVIERPGALEGRFVGIMAGYRDLDGTQWRTTLILPEPQNTNVYKVWQFSPGQHSWRIDFGAKGITVGEPESSWW